MKKLLSFTFVALGWVVSHAQLTVNNTLYSVTQLVDGVLVPTSNGTIISNVQFGGVYNQSSRYQIGYFTTATSTATQMGMGSGVMITSGNTSEIPLALGTDPRAAQLSRNYVSCTTGEIRRTTTTGTCTNVQNDLVVLSGNTNYFNTAVLEFDFVPVTSNVSFRYVFGSEEFEDNSGLINYQCSDYSDRFGFLLSGPGIAGGQGYTNNAKNIARLANGSIVSINSVNNGVVGSSGGGPMASKCLAANASWVNNNPVAEYFGPIQGTQMNGNTRVLTAYQGGLTPGATYHIRLIIMDVSDGAYDSVVYLEAGSFSTTTNPLPVVLGPFSALCEKNKGVVVKWDTESERNNERFFLERSTSNEEFELLTTVEGHGTSDETHHYTYIDENAPLGVNYYRLVQEDENGKRTLLETIAVYNSCTLDNPNGYIVGYSEENNALQLNYSVDKREIANVFLYDLAGNIVQHWEVELSPSEVTTSLPVENAFADGIYMIKIQNNEQVYTTKTHLSH
ncbi:MAG: choice-of-anchor L domain-containing protein [Fluviicola sp.]